MNKTKEYLLEGRLLGHINSQVAHGLGKFPKFLGEKWKLLLSNIDKKLIAPTEKHFRNKIKIRENVVVIATNTFNYTCNPKYIYMKLREMAPELQIYWLVDSIEKRQDQYPRGTKLIELGTAECFQRVYSAKVWLNNGIVFSNYFDKKPGQLYLQTMHGSLGIKRLDNAVLARNARGEKGQRVVRREEQNTNIVFTNSAFEEEVFRHAFWHDTPMERLGHARTDILFEGDSSEIRKSIRWKLFIHYGIPEDYKLVLFAPTHRSGMTTEDLDIDFTRLRSELSLKFGGRYCILLRLHDRSFALRDKLANTLVRGISERPAYEQIAEQKISEYVDHNVGADKFYWYRAVAYTPADIETHYSNTQIKSGDGRLGMPRILSVEPEVGGMRIKWQEVEGAAKYEIYRKVGDGEWEMRRRLLADFKEMLDPTVNCGAYNSYRICAIDNDGRRSDVDADGLTVYYNRPLMYEVKKAGNAYAVTWKEDNRAAAYKVFRTPANPIFDMSEYPDIQELMMVTDIGITDYSSWIYDYVYTGKPGFLYVPDIDRYNTKTQLAYTLDKTPFAVCEDTDDLINAILEFDMEKYTAKVQAFLDEKEAVDDGHAAERVAARIIELM